MFGNFTWILLWAVLPTLVYLGIGLFILSLEQKKGPGYKLPALIYFISVPSIIVIVIALNFAMNYESGRFESADKPVGYELYKFLVLKDIIPRSGQSIDEKEEIKVVEKKEETKVAENKKESAKEKDNTVLKTSTGPKIYEVDYDVKNFSYKYQFDKIKKFKKKYAENQKILNFRSKNSKDNNVDVNVFVKFKDEFLGSIIELKFVSLDDQGNTEEVKLNVYDKDPTSHGILIKFDGKKKFGKMSWVNHRGKKVIWKGHIHKDKGLIYNIYQENRNNNYNKLIMVTSKNGSLSEDVIEIDDYYKVDKKTNKSVYDLESILDYFTKDLIGNEKDLIYFKLADNRILGGCNNNTKENVSYYLTTYTCDKIEKEIIKTSESSYEEKFYNTMFKDFKKTLANLPKPDENSSNFVEVNQRLIKYLDKFYLGNEPSLDFADVLFDNNAGKKKHAVDWGWTPETYWKNLGKNIMSLHGKTGYLLFLKGSGPGEDNITEVNLKNGYSHIFNESYDKTDTYYLYFKSEVQSKPFTEPYFLSDESVFPKEFKDLMKTQEKFYQVELKNFKDQTEKIRLFNFFNEKTQKEEFLFYKYNRDEKRFVNIINFKINPNKHIFDINKSDGELFNQVDKTKRVKFVKDYLDAILEWNENKSDFNIFNNLWYHLIDKEILNKKELIADGQTIETPIENNKFVTSENYYALVIGNNNYQYLEKLDAAENDAKVIADILENKYGFEVELLLNGDYSTTVNSIFNMTKKLKENDNLLIYYAGHGELDKSENRGYWLPVNASTKSRAEWISNQRIVDRVKATKAKHVLLMVDSCFSGSLMRGGELSEENETIDKKYIERLKKKKTRLVITSGGNEPVVDSDGGNHSLFALKLIDTLKNNDNVINSQILFENIRRYVVANADQTPERAMVHKTGHDGGDFLFFPK